MGEVFRVGNTVRRPAGPWTRRVQQLMRGLRATGLEFVPEPLGIEGPGREVVAREVVAYVEGDVGVDPAPNWVWSDQLLLDVGLALRRLHDASGALRLPGEGRRRAAHDPAEVICHGDVAPYNTVCRHGRLVAFIDWDFARPAPRGWDLGYAAYRWISLTGPGNPDGRAASVEEQRRRRRFFCDAYGDVRADEVLSWAVRRLDDLADYIRTEAGSGRPAFAAMLARGDADLYETNARWIRHTYDVR